MAAEAEENIEAVDARLDDHPGDEAGEEERIAVRPPDPQSRARLLAARRRMLMMLVALTAAASGIVAVKLAAWWVTIPPAGMLAGYLLLLREVRHVDAEHARDLADAMARAERRRRVRERELALQREEAVAAPVIDISVRVKDELYDQYADTERRAVGD